MARGDHPMRTPFYGAVMMAVAFASGYPTAKIDITWLRIAVFAVLVLVAGAGFLMTFRDYS